MLGRLITIETYMNAMHASLAKNHLEAAGIRCVLADEFAVSNFWHLSNAIGGIKLQVAEEDFERANAVLDALEANEERQDPLPSSLPGVPSAAESRAERAAEPISEDEIAEGAAPEPKPGALPGVPGEDDDPEELPLNTREETAERAYRTVLIGLMFPPMQLYATWLLCDVWQSDLPLRPSVRKKIKWAVIINIPGVMLGMATLLAWLGGLSLPSLMQTMP